MRTALTVTGPEGQKRTYTATEATIDMGTCMDVLGAFRADIMLGMDGSPESQMALAREIIPNMMNFYPIAARLFPGLTEEEWRSSKPKEAVGVMRDLLLYSFETLGTVMEDDPKTPKRRKNRRGSRRPSSRSSSTSSPRSPTASLP